MADRLLPPNASELERALEQVTARLGEVSVPLRSLWNPQTCPAEILPWLAWSLSVDEWDSSWPEATKREVIARAAELHRRKGTVWAVREALRSAGYADAEIEEGLPRLLHDGTQTYGGEEIYGAGARWALFKVVADLGEDLSLTTTDIERLVRLIERYKPASRHLREIAYRATLADDVPVTDAVATVVMPAYEEVRPAGLRYDGSIAHDQDVPLRFDGRYLYDAYADHDGRDELGETHANEWDATEMAMALELGSDHVAIDAIHDGRLTYSGFSYGSDAPMAVDAAMPLTITRHVRHDGRHNHGGTHYNGAASYDGAEDYFGGIYYAGNIQQQEAVL